ncbi:flagellar hook-length control protein FliK [Euzebya sp.]|uniref:flagellar hook-length control protein FliK n=1 Tax=Euzebya sp. TaxID=1971409 RepID=UPI003511AAD4
MTTVAPAPGAPIAATGPTPAGGTATGAAPADGAALFALILGAAVAPDAITAEGEGEAPADGAVGTDGLIDLDGADLAGAGSTDEVQVDEVLTDEALTAPVEPARPASEGWAHVHLRLLGRQPEAAAEGSPTSGTASATPAPAAPTPAPVAMPADGGRAAATPVEGAAVPGTATSPAGPAAATEVEGASALPTTADQPVADVAPEAEPAAPTVRVDAVAARARTEAAPATTGTTPTTPQALPEPPSTQLASAVAALRRRGDGEYTASLDLHPAELGRVRIDLEVRAGVVHVQMAAEQTGTRALLASQLADLRTALEQGGMDAGSLDVSQEAWQHQQTSHDGEGRSEGGSHPSAGTSGARTIESERLVAVGTVTTTTEHRTDTSVDLRV